MQIIFLLTGVVTGILITMLVMNARIVKSGKVSDEKFNSIERERSILKARFEDVQGQLQMAQGTLSQERQISKELNALFAEQKVIAKNLQEKLDVQKSDLEELHKRFTMEFENLSSKILEEKSKKFTEQNRTNLDIILNPLREKIKEFEEKVENSYKVESAERNSLKGEIKSLMELNQRISTEANNLARALKGDTKKQGNWGEMILERILERSGLIKGSEYEVQFSTSNENGQRIQPDAVIYLPDNKHIIVDAKVSLIAYEAMVNSVLDEDRDRFLKEHVQSIRNHIKLLNEKIYYTSKDLNSPDFVLIFLPIEPSFGIAIQQDAELFNYAWDRKIVLVSPSTLLATLKTVGAIWKQERQTRNAFEIAKAGGALYDKFVSFLKDMDTVGERIRMAEKSHDEAMLKLRNGSGNIIKRIEDLRKLGAKATKELPLTHLEKADDYEDENV